MAERASGAERSRTAALLSTQLYMETSHALIAKRRRERQARIQKRIVTLQQKQARRRKQFLLILAVVAHSSVSVSLSSQRRCWSVPK